jgi:hypothetical protein
MWEGRADRHGEGVVAIQSDMRSRMALRGKQDDWFAGNGEFDWPEEPTHEEALGAQRPDDGWSPGSEPVPQRTAASAAAGPPPVAATFVRRRRILVFTVLGLAIATAVTIALATGGGHSGQSAFPPAAGNSSNSSANTTAHTSGSAATGAQPATTSQTRTQPKAATGATKTQASSTSLRVTLPSNAALSTGDSGQAVVKLQKALKKLGYDVGADGSFGTATETAVKAFQKANGLTADGIAGAATVQKLNKALANS